MNYINKFCFVLMLLFFSKLEAANYIFTSQGASYSPISGGRLLGTPGSIFGCYIDSNNTNVGTYPAPNGNILGTGFSIGFNFKYDTQICTRFCVASDGWIYLGTPVTLIAKNYYLHAPFANSILNGNSTSGKIIAGCAGRLASNSASSLMYKLVGTAPYRSLVIQWNNFSRDSSLQDTINFQIRLNETTNTIDVVYGNMYLSTTQTDMQVGLSIKVIAKQIRKILTDWNTSTLDTMPATYCKLSYTIYPSNGLTFTWTPPPACLAPPTPGMIYASADTVCSNIPLGFFLNGYSDGLGQTFQWQSSTDSITWTNIPSAIFTSCQIPSQSISTYYRCELNCSGMKSYPIPVRVTQSPSNQCYCISHASDPYGSDINIVQMDSLYYGDSTLLPYVSPYATQLSSDLTPFTIYNFHAGAKYTMRVSRISDRISFEPYKVAAFIDFNNNFVFDTLTERFNLGDVRNFISPDEVTGTISIPSGTTLGNKRMRIILIDNLNPLIKPCQTYYFGETEDYIINILPPLACSAMPVAGIASASVGNKTIAAITPVNLKLTGYSLISNQNYQWKMSTDSINWSNLPQGTLPAVTVNLQTSSFLRCEVSCSGNTAISNTIYVSVNPYCSSASTNANGADIGQFQFGSFTNMSAGGLSETNNSSSYYYYTDFTNKIITTNQGETIHITVTQINSGAITYGIVVYACIDLNNDGLFDPTNEMIYMPRNLFLGSGTNIYDVYYKIPYTSSLGKTRLRILMSDDNDPCGTYLDGETEDYSLTILPSVTNFCSNISGANLVATASMVCPGSQVTYSIEDTLFEASGIIYHWESSTDSIHWKKEQASLCNIFKDSIYNQAKFHRCILICSDGSVDSSNVTFTQIRPSINCYCDSQLGGSLCSAGGVPISNVSITGTTLNNSDISCNQNSSGSVISTFVPSGNKTTTLHIGQTYTLNVSNDANCAVSAWIDYNRNGTYETNEWISVCSTTPQFNFPNSKNFTVPWGSTPGLTGLRVRNVFYNTPFIASSACSTVASGETEEYLITLDVLNKAVQSTEELGFSIFPNPATNKLFLHFAKNASKKTQINISNTLGQIVLTENLNNNTPDDLTIDIANLKRGMYIVQVSSDTVNSFQKIVIEK